MNFATLSVGTPAISVMSLWTHPPKRKDGAAAALTWKKPRRGAGLLLVLNGTGGDRFKWGSRLGGGYRLIDVNPGMILQTLSEIDQYT